jgi:hypothetical protein
MEPTFSFPTLNKNEVAFVWSGLILSLSTLSSMLLSSYMTQKPMVFYTSQTLFLPSSQEEFSCGGGPFSFYAASLVSTTCDRPRIHTCCAAHDICYESAHLNQTYCDEIFCNCLNNIESSHYCDNFAQPGLCLATHVFGHLFYQPVNCTTPNQPGCSEQLSAESRAQQNVIGSTINRL